MITPYHRTEIYKRLTRNHRYKKSHIKFYFQILQDSTSLGRVNINVPEFWSMSLQFRKDFIDTIKAS